VEAVLETVDERVATLAAGGTHRAVWDALGDGPRTVQQLAAATGRTPANLRKSLRRLRDMSLVMQEGGKGRTTTYHRIREERSGEFSSPAGC
jgi:predicted transcriptional regulator